MYIRSKAELENLIPKNMTINTWYLAYSGGLDSTVLLHCLWQQHWPVHAIHINHQLQSMAEQWAQHCASQCAQWQIPCTIKKVNAQKQPGQSPEAAAREARYAAFAQIMTPDSVLCTAHQQDDQAETLLLQLIRGAGVAGLAAMPESMPFAQGHLLRPLLTSTRQELEQYAKAHQLSWIDDPSNQHMHYDRNYLRQHIMPLLRARWPSVTETVSRSANHCAEAMHLITQIAQQDWMNLRENDPYKIAVSKLQTLSSPQQRQVIRHWLEQCHLPLPSTVQMKQLQMQFLDSREDAQPKMHWQGIYVRRYQDYLYVGREDHTQDLSQYMLSWDLQQPLKLPFHLGVLTAKIAQGNGISKQRLAQAPISIRFRRGGERCQPQGRSHSQTLKKLFQEYEIPPWQRNYIPLLFCGDDLVSVLGYWICHPFVANINEEGWEIEQKMC